MNPTRIQLENLIEDYVQASIEIYEFQESFPNSRNFQFKRLEEHQNSCYNELMNFIIYRME